MQIKNFFYKIATEILRKIYAVLGTSTVGVRALILDDKNRFLMVKHTYRPGWYLPGGGVNHGETTLGAVKRELIEEAGVIVNTEPELFGIYFQNYLGSDDYPILYIVKDFQLTTSNSSEIAEIARYSYENLPTDTTPSTRRRLAEYFDNANISAHW